jgi:hypothetical protein
LEGAKLGVSFIISSGFLSIICNIPLDCCLGVRYFFDCFLGVGCFYLFVAGGLNLEKTEYFNVLD